MLHFIDFICNIDKVKQNIFFDTEKPIFLIPKLLKYENWRCFSTLVLQLVNDCVNKCLSFFIPSLRK